MNYVFFTANALRVQGDLALPFGALPGAISGRDRKVAGAAVLWGHLDLFMTERMGSAPLAAVKRRVCANGLRDALRQRQRFGIV